MDGGSIRFQEGVVVLVPPATRDNAAKLAADSLQFLSSVQNLCAFAGEWLAAAKKQGDYVDQQKLHVAALKLRLNRLVQERKRVDQEGAQAVAAKQAELDKLSSA